MSGYMACCLYRAVKLHFTSNYDFNKYHGKVKYTTQQFENNKQKYVYEKLSKKLSNEDLKFFYIVNFLNNESVWIQDLLQQEAFDIFNEYSKKKQSLSYFFENDLLDVFSGGNHKELFNCNSNDFPLLLKKMLRNEISIETLIIMDDIFPFLNKWDSNITDSFIWPKVKLKLLKYKPFLEYDRNKFKTILVKIINETKII